MNWKVNGQEVPVMRLAAVLGLVSGLLAGLIAFLAQADIVKVTAVAVVFGLGGALAVLVIYLTDLALTAKAEGQTRRAKLKAAHRLYTAWAEGTLEPPTDLKTATYKVGGEVRRLDWLHDDDPDTAKWRMLQVTLFQRARVIARESGGKRTGLTEADMVGDTAAHMFYGRDAYRLAIRIAKDLGLVEVINGIPTRLAEGWTFQKVVHYLQTAAVIPPIKERPVGYRSLPGSGS